MKKWAAVLSVLAVLALAAPASAEVTFNGQQDFSMVQWVPCANGGAGEYLTVAGPLHILFTFTEDGNGSVHTKYHFQPHGLRAYGNDTGDRYNATGVTQGKDSTAATGYPYTYTWVNNFRMIGQGPGSNFSIHQNIHITVNANGEVTAEVDNQRVTCK